MKRKNNTINVSKYIFVVLVVSFFSIVIKLSFVSLSKETNGINLTEFVKNRNTEKETIKAQRGTIYSVDGEILAHSVNSYTVIAILSESRTTNEDDPEHVVDYEKTAEELSKILGAPKDTILNRLNSGKESGVYQVELRPYGHNINSLVKKQIEALGLPGIDFIEGTKRYYPRSTLSPYIIGYARTNDEGKIVGEMGIEAYYDEELQGKDGYTIYQKDAYGYSMPNTVTITEPAEPGQDIYLTLDSQIQLFVENGIKDITADNNMDWLTFSVMDAKTGAIVASGSNPSFNLNSLQIESYLNPLTAYQYEPGSTMKIFSFLAAMEAGKYDGSAKYDSGKIKVDNAIIKDFNGKGWGPITYDSGFAYSSNVAATKLALSIGREELYNYYAKLGFGKKTGITLPSEASGTIDFTYRTELATASFGQGITTTPIQNLQALTILTNEGVEIKPYIVEKIVNSETGEVTYQHEVEELGQKASKENVDKMLTLLHDVVYSGKTDAKYYQTENVTLVGKTGTAEFTGDNGKYMEGKYDYVRSFAGVFPYEDPQYIIYVSVKRYDGSYKEFAKMVTKVVEEIAKYKNITELVETIDKTRILEMNNYISTETTITEDKLKKLGFQVVKLGNGKYIINQYPEKGSTILVGNKIFLITNDTEYLMPDITGWSISDVTVLCKLLNIDYKYTGYGKVKTFNIAPETKILPNAKLEITLE